MKKPNALLEWKGRKLLCNGICVATIGKFRVSAQPTWWYRGGNHVNRDNYIEANVYGQRASEESARRAVEKRFKLK